jgi:hypothetical protein
MATTQRPGTAGVAPAGLGSTFVADEELLLSELMRLEMPAPA